MYPPNSHVIQYPSHKQKMPRFRGAFDFYYGSAVMRTVAYG